MAQTKAAILNVGMMTAVGLDAKQTAASVRAGIARFAETSIHNKRFEPMVMALLPDDALPPLVPEIDKIAGLTSRQMRMLRLAAPALQESLKGMPQSGEIVLSLGLPAGLPDRPKPADEKFLERLATQSGIKVDTKKSKVFPNGRAAGLYALKAALEQLTAGGLQCAIVGGVDTYLDLYLLGTMDMEGRILGSGVMDGFIPGEGAGFVVMATVEMAKKNRLNPIGYVTYVATGMEEGHLYSDKPYKGDGLSIAFTELFEKGGVTGPVEEVFISMNGENHWAKEWGVAYLRSKQYFSPEHGMHHPADCYGDTGAASGVIMIGMGAVGMRRGYRKSPCLVTCSADTGECAATAIFAN